MVAAVGADGVVRLLCVHICRIGTYKKSLCRFSGRGIFAVYRGRAGSLFTVLIIEKMTPVICMSERDINVVRIFPWITFDNTGQTPLENI